MSTDVSYHCSQWSFSVQSILFGTNILILQGEKRKEPRPNQPGDSSGSSAGDSAGKIHSEDAFKQHVGKAKEEQKEDCLLRRKSEDFDIFFALQG